MNEIMTFLKFGTKENLEKLQQGKIYCRSVQYFRELEDKENNSYIGDKNEGAFKLTNCEAILQPHDREGVPLNIPECNFSITFNDVDKCPIFCMTYISLCDLKEIPGKNDEYELHFNQLFQEKFTHDEWDYVLLINPSEFIKKVNEYVVKNDIYYKADCVNYDDFKINHQKRIDKFQENRTNVAFYKDIEYEGQREYRILFNSLQTSKDIPVELNIGDISDCTYLVKREKLFNDIIVKLMPKNEI